MKQDVMLGIKSRSSWLCKNIRTLPSIKTVHVIKILLWIYFGFWFDQGSFILSSSTTASSDITKKQYDKKTKQTTLVMGGEIQSSVHPNIPSINHLWLLKLPDSRPRAKEHDVVVQGMKDGNTL